jgi:hypothetical protein
MNTHNTWNYRDCINTNWVDGRTLQFLRRKWKNPNEADMYQTVSDEEMSYQSYEMICRLLYGLTIAQLREHPKEEVDALIIKYKDLWNSLVTRSIKESEKQHDDTEWDNYTTRPVKLIGTFELPNNMVTVTVPDFV